MYIEFTRRVYTLFDVLEAKANGVTLISVSESLETSSSLLEGVMLMLGIIAGWKWEAVVERVNAGMRKASTAR